MFDLGSLATVSTEPLDRWASVYDTAIANSLFNNSGVGAARFSPLIGEDGTPTGTFYLARNPAGGLLETVFHTITTTTVRAVHQDRLRGRAMRAVTAPSALLLADLRDPELERLGIERTSLVATSEAHYQCTRLWADRLRQATVGERPLDGILWNSRIAEIATVGSAPVFTTLLTEPANEVCVLFQDRLPTATVQSFDATDLHSDLASGSGLAMCVDLATQLGGYITT